METPVSTAVAPAIPVLMLTELWERDDRGLCRQCGGVPEQRLATSEMDHSNTPHVQPVFYCPKCALFML